MAVSDGSGEIIYRFVYSTYGELYDIKDGNSNSLGNIAASEGYTYAEMAHALGMEYLYNGQYGVATDIDGLYYMRARYYDQSIKRFINRDVLSGDIGNSQSLNRFSYVQGNPVSLTDPFGLCPDGNSAESLAQQTASSLGFFSLAMEGGGIDWSDLGHTALDLIGIVWDGADIINAVWYGLEGNYAMAAVSAICALPFVGSLVGGSAGMALKVIGHSLTFGMAAQGTWEAAGKAVEAYQNGTFSAWNVLDVGLNALGMGLSGRATFSEGRKLANRIAASETGQKIVSGIKAYAADNRGCVDLEALGLVKSKGGNRADLGNKLDYQFGKAGGNQHNIDRTRGLKAEMDKLGFNDTLENREYFEQYYNKVLNDSSNIVGTPEVASYTENGIIHYYTVTTRESFLMGRYGGAKVTTHWDGNRLLTIKISSGKESRYNHIIIK